MKRFLKSSLSIFLAITIIFSSAYVGLNEVDFSGVLVVDSRAASESALTFTLNDDGESYSVTGCDTSAESEIVIPETYNDLPVIKIKDYAFDYYENIVSVTIPDSVTNIGSYAFYSCTSLKSIKIPDSVTSLGTSSFSGCANLTSIEIGSGVTSIGSMVFYNCKNLEKVYWNAKNVADFNSSSNVFYNAGVSGLGIDFVFGDTVEKIPVNIFYTYSSSYFPKINTINIGSNLTNLDNDVFYNCVDLKAINVDDNNISFSSDNGVLFNKDKTKILCFPLDKTDKEYSIPKTITTIGESSFYNCTNLISVEIPDSVTNIEDGAFTGCTRLEKVYWNAKNVADFTSSSNVFDDVGTESLGTELVFGNTVESIPAYLCYGDYFSNKPNIKTVKIGNNVARIGKSAFYNCTSLNSVIIPASVTTIGSSAFYNCENLESVYITDITAWCNIDFDGYNSNPLYYANKLYINGVSATDIVVPDGVKRINNYAFYNCTNLESFTMADTVTNIGQSAFTGCTNLYSISLSDNLKFIYNSVFKNCTSLVSVIIPNGVTSIGDYAFQNCSNLSSVTIPDSVTDIGCSAFENCSNLSSVIIPNSVTNISSYTFRNCANLTSLKISDNLTSIGYYVFENCDGLTTVVIPTSVKSIGLNAFANCDNLTSITIPNSVTSINSSAFDDCSQQLVIKTSCSSYALEYANNNNINVEVIDSGHISLGWIVDESATVYKSGSKHKECTECGEILETATIPQLKCSAPVLKKVYNANSYVKVTWGTVKGADKYYVYRKTGTGDYEFIGSTTNTYFNDKEAGAGKTCRYRIRVKNEAGYSEYSDTLAIKHIDEPTLKSIENSAYGVLIKWDKVTGAEKYNVYRKTGGGEYKYIGATTKTYYTDKTAESGTKYYYAIRGKRDDSISSQSASLSKYYLEAPILNTPTSTTKGVGLKWTQVDGAEGYMVYRRTADGSYKRITTEEGISNVTFRDTTAKKGTKYYYKVKAYKSKTYSAYSKTKAITDKY